MALSFLATMAEEESHTRSRSMETSLRMRLDNGIPLTPKLLGHSHDEDGQLVTDFVNIIVIFDRGCYKHSRFIVTEETLCLATFELPVCSRGFMYTPNAHHNTGNCRKNKQYA